MKEFSLELQFNMRWIWIAWMLKPSCLSRCFKRCVWRLACLSGNLRSISPTPPQQPGLCSIILYSEWLKRNLLTSCALQITFIPSWLNFQGWKMTEENTYSLIESIISRSVLDPSTFPSPCLWLIFCTSMTSFLFKCSEISLGGGASFGIWPVDGSSYQHVS